ncbi:MAG: CRTAC1 family protein [Bacteriovoracaceae bacterium]|nr:CRTAC1 family protein [Bacteriovoracaceae bacterium]
MFLFFIGKWSGAIPPSDYSFSLYSFKRNGFLKSNPGFFLKEKRELFPTTHIDLDPDTFPRFQARMPGFVVLCDLNNDEFEDVVTIYNKPDKFGLLEIFKNDNGNKFLRATNEIGLKEAQENYSFTVAACADFDNDGWLDLVLGGIGQNLFVYKNDRGHFKKNSEILAFDETRVINIFDANKDGYLDIFIGNYRFLPNGKSKMARRLRDGGVGMNSINEKGGIDKIYLNQGDGKTFISLAEDNFYEDGYTWASGISDFDGDGNVDLLVPHDLGRDEIFRGDGTGHFKNVTNESLGPLRARGSMSASVIDLNDDGLQDVFISNTNRPGFAYGDNSMWMNRADSPGDFQDKAIDFGIDACGVAWGAQFADLNQDGWLDLAVVNGIRGLSEGITEKGWFWWVYTRGAPDVDLDFLSSDRLRLFPKTKQKKVKKMVPIASSQQKCLFMGGSSGKFLDAAPMVGFANTRIARGLVIFDYDKNGTEDLLMVDPYNGPILFENTVTNPGKWIAVRLKGTTSNYSGIGSKLQIITNKRTIYREYFPFNGFQSGASREIFLTFRENEYPSEIKVIWPTGKESVQEIHDINKRWHIQEPKI